MGFYITDNPLSLSQYKKLIKEQDKNISMTNMHIFSQKIRYPQDVVEPISY